MLNVVIDGRPASFPEGDSVLRALRSVGIRLPTLCHDDRLTPAGVCRTCLVRINGAPRPVPACTTPLEDGMQIETVTHDLEASRRSALTLLAWRYPAAAAREFPGREFHRELHERGLDQELCEIAEPATVDRSHPYITVDMSRCIHCYRCVQICADVQGQFVWHVRGRGADTRVEADGPTLRESSCVSCGACVDTCPTGALEDATTLGLGTASAWTRTTCPYCGVGCEMTVGTRDGRIVAIRPVMDAPVSKGHLCVKGRYAFEFVRAGDRVLEPMIRERGAWRRASWDEALGFAARRLRDLIDKYGPDSIGVLGSARATNEDNYLCQKFARVVIGTNNVDCCARVCHAPSAAALKHALGSGFGTNSFDDIEIARAILVCGANSTEDHPIVGARITQAARRGATLIVIDPRRIELAAYAACHVPLRPGTNIPLLNAMAHTIVAEHLGDRTFLDSRVSGLDHFTTFIDAWTPERAAAICGVDAALIRRAARLYAGTGPAMIFHGLGVTEHVQGTDGVTALINLALLTGNVGKAGAGVNALRGQNNVQGAAHMGCDPKHLAGSTPVEKGRAGLHLMEMLDAAVAGRLRALWAIGYDVFLTNPNATVTARALRNLDLVIVQDLFLTETARDFGSVFLPACSSFEKDGTFMNAERRIQRVRQAVEPAGQSKADWRIICELARACGRPDGFAFTRPEEIWNEVRTLCEGARGMSYARLDRGGLQWPCPSDDHPGTPVLHRDSFSVGPRASLACLEYRPSPEQTSARYPFLLTTGRSLYQFNAGTMTARTPNIDLRPTDVVDLSPDDASRLRVRDGQPVRLVSRYGAATLPVRLNPAVQRGQPFATFHSAGVFLNRLTGPHRDPAVGTPEYKLVAVRIERLRHTPRPTDSPAPCAGSPSTPHLR